MIHLQSKVQEEEHANKMGKKAKPQRKRNQDPGLQKLQCAVNAHPGFRSLRTLPWPPPTFLATDSAAQEATCAWNSAQLQKRDSGYRWNVSFARRWEAAGEREQNLRAGLGDTHMIPCLQHL
ncbi:hepatocyte nuclear factor 4-beta-like [Platysternon megacephalum]|uniref:Hepatocyte nuclear factor 4-beta-like n=1 Tax=Platysternon megacephalum TaxID=55544 RepID=A0A4D9EN95_9SAUR|nr:hepatocyte nuclear factor 4-beta-like [Platysternon megacephalum]